MIFLATVIKRFLRVCCVMLLTIGQSDAEVVYDQSRHVLLSDYGKTLNDAGHLSFGTQKAILQNIRKRVTAKSPNFEQLIQEAKSRISQPVEQLGVYENLYKKAFYQLVFERFLMSEFECFYKARYISWSSCFALQVGAYKQYLWSLTVDYISLTPWRFGVNPCHILFDVFEDFVTKKFGFEKGTEGVPVLLDYLDKNQDLMKAYGYQAAFFVSDLLWKWESKAKASDCMLM
jgi:hypothetical protein